jgi:uncharacterized protein
VPSSVDKFRVVIDTNVWISGQLTLTGVTAELTRFVVQHGLPVFSDPTFEELKTRLWRPKFDRYLSVDRRNTLLQEVHVSGFWVDIHPEMADMSFCRDPSDDKFIQLALSAKAPMLVTGDQDLLLLAADFSVQGLSILTPKDALTQLQTSLV